MPGVAAPGPQDSHHSAHLQGPEGEPQLTGDFPAKSRPEWNGHLQLSRDARQVLAEVKDQGGFNLWALENFEPAEKKRLASYCLLGLRSDNIWVPFRPQFHHLFRSPASLFFGSWRSSRAPCLVKRKVFYAQDPCRWIQRSENSDRAGLCDKRRQTLDSAASRDRLGGLSCPGTHASDWSWVFNCPIAAISRPTLI
jgi:hypothetical protein